MLPRDVLELKALGERQPELAPAVNLQVDLIEAVRRVQSRITTPWIETSTETLSARLVTGQPLLEFSQIAFDWNDVRLLIRQVTDVLRRHEVIDAPTATALHSVGRSPTLPDVMRAWFEHQPTIEIEMIDEVLGWAARPYLQRTAEVLQQRVSLDGWTRARVPGLRGGARVLGDHHQRRAPVGLRPLPRPLGLQPDRLSVLRQRRSHDHQVDGHAPTASIA